FANVRAAAWIYTLSLHDALPIYPAPRARRQHRIDVVRRRDPLVLNLQLLVERVGRSRPVVEPEKADVGAALGERRQQRQQVAFRDRKSTRLNSSHLVISYAVFCL